MVIEIGELLHDAIFACSTLFACAYVFGKLSEMIRDIVKE